MLCLGLWCWRVGSGRSSLMLLLRRSLMLLLRCSLVLLLRRSLMLLLRCSLVLLLLALPDVVAAGAA